MSINPLGYVPPQGPSKTDGESASRMKPAEAAKAFEAYLAQIMIKEMRRTVPKGMFASQAMDMFNDVLDKELATRISESGGLGIANVIRSALEGNGQSITPQQLQQLHPEQAPIPLGDRLHAALPVNGKISSDFGHRIPRQRGTVG